jgi:Tol biopolymer transport system component
VIVIAGSVALAWMATGASGAGGNLRRIAFIRGVRIHHKSVSFVWIADANGGSQHRLGRGDFPLLSPNGRLVAARTLNSASGLAIYSTVGGGTQHYFPSSDYGLALAWSPDSRYLAVNAGIDGLEVIDTTLHAMTQIPTNGYVEGSFAPTLPDRLVYVSGGGSGRDIYTTSPTGSGTLRLTHNGRSSYPIWGPKEIAFAGISEIWLMRPDGSHRRRLTHLHAPRFGGVFPGVLPWFWSPDGRHLIIRDQAPAQYTWVVSVPSGRAHSLTLHRSVVFVEGVSRNDRRLLIGGTSGIATISLRGTGFKPLINNAGEATWNL